MNLRDLKGNELAAFIREIKRLLSEGEPASLDEGARAMMIEKFRTLPDEIDAVTGELDLMKREMKAKTVHNEELKTKARDAAKQMQMWLKAIGADNAKYKLFGFDPPVSGRKRVEVADPENLTAAWTPEGTLLRFVGNNRSGTVDYQIYRREGDSEEWRLHAGSTKQRYLDKQARPGVRYEYKVKAQSARDVSAFSNTAVVGS